MTDEQTKSSRGCRNVLVLGCGVLTLLALVVAILVAVNFGRIRDSVSALASEAQETFGEMLEVRGALVTAYGTNSVFVNKRYGPGGTTLIVEFTNPPFLKAERVEAETKAKEIAQFTKTKYGSADELEGITVVFTTKVGAGFSVSNKHGYHFSTKGLSEPSPQNEKELPMVP